MKKIVTITNSVDQDFGIAAAVGSESITVAGDRIYQYNYEGELTGVITPDKLKLGAGSICSLASNEKYLVVGAPIEDGAVDKTVHTTGRVCLIKHGDNTPCDILVSPDDGDLMYGVAVAISTDSSILAVAGGAAVYMYKRTNESWFLNQVVKRANCFGLAFSPSGEKVFIGQHADNRVMVYERYDELWKERYVHNTSIPAPVPEAAKQFGVSVAYSGGQLIVGDRYADKSGCVYSFIHSGREWELSNRVAARPSKFDRLLPRSCGTDGYGTAVAADGGIVVVTAHERGKVYVYSATDE